LEPLQEREDVDHPPKVTDVDVDVDGERSVRSSISKRALDSLRSSVRTGAEDGEVRSLRRWGSVKELMSPLMVRSIAIVATCVLVPLIGAVLYVRSSASSPASARPTVEVDSPTLGSTTTTEPTLVVAVGGAVRAPGVYRLRRGTRVVDALEAAGGPSEDIDLDAMNLAAPLADGERVWVPRRGQPAPSVADGSSASSTPSANRAGPLDLNTATLEQLDGLSGVGPSTAKAIIERRRELGRFRSVDDLLSVKGIGAAKLEAFRNDVVVR